MSSPRRIAASRANGARSHGPASAEGRQRCQLAALSHGLTSRRIVLDNESVEDFNALRQAYLDEIRPTTQFELDLVDQWVAARWRLDRIWAIETALIEIETSRQQPKIKEEFESCDADTQTAIAFRSLCDASTTLAVRSRYEGRFRRTCDRVAKMLAFLRAHQKVHKGPKPKNEHPDTVN